MMEMKLKDEPVFPTEAEFRAALERGVRKRRELKFSRELLERAEALESEAYGAAEPKNDIDSSYGP